MTMFFVQITYKQILIQNTKHSVICGADGQVQEIVHLELSRTRK